MELHKYFITLKETLNEIEFKHFNELAYQSQWLEHY